ncbi:MAG: avidin/streptavidin family protein [Pseudomonadota bacterium]
MDIQGDWINQYGSTVTFEVDDDGNLSGWYNSRKGRSASGREYALYGRQNGEVISFCVDWQGESVNLHAITTFSGRCVRGANGQEEIHTMWTLARQFEDTEMKKPTGAWNAFLTNADIFVRDE